MVRGKLISKSVSIGAHLFDLFIRNCIRNDEIRGMLDIDCFLFEKLELKRLPTD